MNGAAFQKDHNPAERQSPEMSCNPDQPITSLQVQHVTALYDLVNDNARQKKDEWRVRENAENQELLGNKESFMHKLQEYSHRGTDELISIAIRANDGSLDDLLVAACKRYTECGWNDFNDWSHSVCHNYEKHTPGVASSVLSFPGVRPAATELYNEVIRRAAEAGLGCTPRMLHGVMQYAFELVTAENFANPWEYKPEGLRNERINALLERNEPDLALFCRSASPRELVATALQRELPARIPRQLLELYYQEEQTSERRDAIAQHIARTRHYYNLPTSAEDSAVSVPEIAEQLDNLLAAAAAPVLPGIYVDVDGTLIQKERTGAERLSDIGVAVRALFAEPGHLTIVTGGDPESATARLRELGFPECVLPVQSKQTLVGKRVELLIDDTPSEAQSLRAEREYGASSYGNHEVVNTLMRMDPCRVLPRYQTALAEHNASISLDNTGALPEARKSTQRSDATEHSTHQTDQQDTGQDIGTVRFYESMFSGGVPIHSGREWQSMSTGQIADRFIAAAFAIQRLQEAYRNEMLSAHDSKNPIKRWIDTTLRGWKAPEVSTVSGIASEIGERCKDLSDWMARNQGSKFYCDSDMGDYIRKPLVVAELIRSRLQPPLLSVPARS
jgi:hypothetical protein